MHASRRASAFHVLFLPHPYHNCCIKSSLWTFLHLLGQSFLLEASTTLQEYYTRIAPAQVTQGMTLTELCDCLGGSGQDVVMFHLLQVPQVAFAHDWIIPCVMAWTPSLCFCGFSITEMIDCRKVTGSRRVVKACHRSAFTYWRSSCLDNSVPFGRSGFSGSCLERKLAWLQSAGSIMEPSVNVGWQEPRTPFFVSFPLTWFKLQVLPGDNPQDWAVGSLCDEAVASPVADPLDLVLSPSLTHISFPLMFVSLKSLI